MRSMRNSYLAAEIKQRRGRGKGSSNSTNSKPWRLGRQVANYLCIRFPSYFGSFLPRGGLLYNM